MSAWSTRYRQPCLGGTSSSKTFYPTTRLLRPDKSYSIRSGLTCCMYGNGFRKGQYREELTQCGQRVGRTTGNWRQTSFVEKNADNASTGTLDEVNSNTYIPSNLSTTPKLGILLLNLGGPETLDDVQPFLYNLFADPDIIRLPPSVQFLQPLIANIISMVRSPKSREGYEAIGGGSPLRQITEEQARALEDSLHAKGIQAKTYVAMRYWKPFTEEAIADIKQDGITSLVVLPLYPQFSVSTSGSSLRLLERILKEDTYLSKHVRHVVIPSWYQRPGYVSAMADLIEGELNKEDNFKQSDAKSVELFFSAHGVPQSYVDEGDPYKVEMEECVELIMEELRRRHVNNPYTLAYQSRVGPVAWLKPYTDDSIRYLGEQRGVKSLLAIPISFVSEHIETLEEIDMEYKELALESGIKNWGRVPALNTNTKFIDDLADAVIEALPYMGTVAMDKNTMQSSIDSIVPIGEVDALLETYDKERKVLPSPVFWEPGWTRSAEMWNGRIAMISIIIILLIEAMTGKGVVQNLLPML